MKRTFLMALLAGIIFALTGCGDGSDAPPNFGTQILSDAALDGDIQQTAPAAFVVTQGMSPTVQSVLAGIDPLTLTEYRAFLDFPLRGAGGVPFNAVIASAILDVIITSIAPVTGTIPIRIELLSFQQPLIATDFDRTLQPPLAFTTILPPISQADVGRPVPIDVTPLMVQAQSLGLTNFQVRIMEDLGPVVPGIIEISDSTGANRATVAPLLDVTFF